MKAIVFAVAGLFAATALTTPSAAAPSFAESSGMTGSTSGANKSRKTYGKHATSRRRLRSGPGYRQLRMSVRRADRATASTSGAEKTRKTYTRRAASRRHLRSSPQYRQLRMSVRRSDLAPASRSGIGARPARWCGWWMRSQIGGGPELNLARNWKNWGRPSGPRVGAVVVWNHHVGLITGRTANGQWIVKSGNDGGRVRERPRSVKGAVFRV